MRLPNYQSQIWQHREAKSDTWAKGTEGVYDSELTCIQLKIYYTTNIDD